MANDKWKSVYVDNNDNPQQQNVTRLENQYTEEEFNTMINSIDSTINELQNDAYARNWGRNESTSGITAQTSFFGKYEDYGQTMQDFAVHDPYGDPNMFLDRYQAFGDAYERLGFSPYRNNEALYNANVSGWDKTKVAMKAFAHLTWIALQQNSFIGSGNTDNDKTKKLATDYNYWNTIGMDTSEGLGAFARNLLVTYGSTAAVMLKMAVEEIAINVGITMLTGGTGTAGTVAATGARFTNFFNKVRSGLKSANVVRRAFRQAGTGERIGYTVSEFIAPGVWTGISKAAHNFGKGKNIAGSLELLHGMYSTARAYKVTQSEALLEANLAAQEYIMEMYNSGKSFTNEQVDMIKMSAEAISNEVFWKNLPAIYISNLVIFNDLLSPVAGRFISKQFKGASKLFGKLPQKLSNGSMFNGIYRVGKTVKKRSEYALKGIPLMLAYNLLEQPAKMFVVGSVEGLQENVQDIINYSARKYYHDMYLDSDRFKTIIGASDYSWFSGFNDAFNTDHFWGDSEAYKQQFTKQGWETFITGTLMGGPTAVISSLVRGGHAAGQRAVDNIKLKNLKRQLDKKGVGTKEYDVAKKEYDAKEKAYNYKYDVKGARTDEWVKIYDNVFNKPTDFFNKNLESMELIDALSSETKEEINRFNELINNTQDEQLREILQQQLNRVEERAKIRQWNIIFRNLCSNGEIELVKSELEKLQNEDEDILSELNNGNGSQDIKNRIKQCLDVIDKTQTVYDGLINRFDNPQNMKALLKKYGCKNEEEFITKYGDNDELMNLYKNEQMLGVAYYRAIDEMVFYANEYESSEQDKKSLLDIFEKTLSEVTKTKLPESSSLTDITSLYTESSIDDLYKSNALLIKSMQSQLEGTEDETERKNIQKRIDVLELRNRQLKIIYNALQGRQLDDNGNVVKVNDKAKEISVDEFKSIMSVAINVYLRSNISENKDADNLSEVLSEYFESYRNSKKLYNALQTITNPRNFNDIINSRNEILWEVYNKRYDIINNSIAKYNEVTEVNDIINELYNMGYAVDNNFIAHLLGQQTNKAGKIYKITDKNFNKEDITTSDGKVSLYKYKDVDEAFKNSFDVAVHPLSKEYHDVINKLTEWSKKHNGKVDGSDIILERIIDLSSQSMPEVNENKKTELSNQNSEDTIESIEQKYLGNDKEKLETLENETLDRPSKHSLADVLRKIVIPKDDDTYSELINAIIKFSEANKVDVIFTTLQDEPYDFSGRTLFLDTRYWDKRYNSNNKESFALGLVGASLGFVLNNYFRSTEGLDNIKSFEDAFGVKGNEKLVRTISSYLIGLDIKGKNISAPENIKKNKNTTGFLSNALEILLSKLGLKSGNEIYDAILGTFGSIGSVSAAEKVKQEAQRQKIEQEKQQTNTSINVINGNVDLTVEDVNSNIPLKDLSNEKKLVLFANPNNTYCNQYIEKHKDEYNEIVNTFKNAVKDSSSTERNKVAEKIGKFIGEKDTTKIKVTDEQFIIYICGLFNIKQLDIDNVNNAITNSVIEPAIVPTINIQQTQNQIIPAESQSTLEKYSKGNNIEFDKKEHKYKIQDKEADTSVTQMVDFLLGSQSAISEKPIETIKGDIFDSAMRSYFSTGSVEGSREEIKAILKDNNYDESIVDELLSQLDKAGNDLKKKITSILQQKFGWEESDIRFSSVEIPLIVDANVKYKVKDGNEQSKQFTLCSTLDMIIQHGDDIIVVDFKTYETKLQLDKYNLQTKLYSDIVSLITGKNVVGRMLATIKATSEIDKNTFNTKNNTEIVVQERNEYGKVGDVSIISVDVYKLNSEPENVNKQHTIDDMANIVKLSIGYIHSIDELKTTINDFYKIQISDEQLKEILNNIIDEFKFKIPRKGLKSGEYIVNDNGKYILVNYENSKFTVEETNEVIKKGSKKFTSFRNNIYDVNSQPYINLLFELDNENLPTPETIDTTENISQIDIIIDELPKIKITHSLSDIIKELANQLEEDCK